MFARLLAEIELFSPDSLASETVSSAFDAAFSLLRRSSMRDEYVYRAALTHNILLGRHSLKTASMLTEFRAGTCKADLIILNGTSTVYEIKSERDSLTRLANQITNYRKVFAKIYVIAGEAHVQNIVESTPSDVGVMSLIRWDRIHTIREAVERYDHICPVTLFESLKVSEARAVLQALGAFVPEVPNTKLRAAMSECFSGLDAAAVHAAMVKTLKASRNSASLADLIDRLPASLQPAALSTHVRHADHERLVRAVRTPLSDAMTWT